MKLEKKTAADKFVRRIKKGNSLTRIKYSSMIGANTIENVAAEKEIPFLASGSLGRYVEKNCSLIHILRRDSTTAIPIP